MSNIFLVLLVGVAGGLGAVCRWAMDRHLGGRGYTLGYPIAMVNLLASLLIGIVAGVFGKSGVCPSPDFYYPIFATGFLGGFSTFSTHLVDAYQLLSKRHTSHHGLIILFVKWLAAPGAVLVGIAVGEGAAHLFL